MAPSLPPYPKMILEAIDGLKQKEGSNKSTISNFIESTYGDLPSGLINELTDNLNKLKESGEIVFVKNNYMRPDPNAPLKRGRGRGRPPKAKDPLVVMETQDPDPVVEGEGVLEVKRGRGRSRKDPSAPTAAKKVKVAAAMTVADGGGGRPRGRPRKVQP